jgi:glycosyltransferase involved in cell wall biosynthesis
MSLAPTVKVVLHTLRHELAERASRTARRASRFPSPLRIGVDIRPFYEPLTGIGWYLHHLLHEFARRDDVELVLFGDARVTDDGPRLHTTLPAKASTMVFDLRHQPLSSMSRPLTAAAYVGLLEAAGVDLVFGANYFLPRLHSAVARRRVVTVHDLTFKRFPELLQKETLENLDRHMKRELAWSDAVICVSESTRQDLLRYYDLDPSRAVTVLSGLADPIAGVPVEGLPSRYLLFVSTIEPRKNLGVLLDAYRRLRQSGAYDGSLVVVGRVGWKSESMLARLREEGIVHLDYVKAPQLATIYERAEAFVFPSIYEGFGFPLLEAMAHGVPTIAADSSSLPEVGGDATLYFAPHDSVALENQLRRLLNEPDLRASLIAKGREQVAKFRWSRAADETLDVFRRVARG